VSQKKSGSKAKPVSVDKDQLAEALKTVEPLTQARSEEKWRSSVMIESAPRKVRVRAQNDNTEATIALNATSGILSSAVPHRAFRKSIDAFAEGKVELSSDEDKLKASRGHRTLSLTQAAGDEFPEPLDVGEPLADQAALKLAGDTLAEALALTGRCASVDETRPSLNSVALDSSGGKLVMVATNSYHLTKIELDVKNDVQLSEPLLVHLSAALAMAKDLKSRKAELAELQLYSDGVSVDYDQVGWRSRRLLGSFPAWRHLLPEQGFELRLDRDELTSSLKAIRAVASGNAPVRIELGSEVIVKYKSMEIGQLEERLPSAVWDGNPMTVGFSHQYLEDLLRVVQGDEITGMLTSETHPAYFSSPGRGYLVMPVRNTEIITDIDRIAGADSKG